MYTFWHSQNVNILQDYDCNAESLHDIIEIQSYTIFSFIGVNNHSAVYKP